MPDGNDANAELWSFSQPSSSVLAKRLAGGTSWADVTQVTALQAGSLPEVEVTSLNGQLYIAAHCGSAENRLFTYDPYHPSGARIRFVGFDYPLATTPTAADGAGAGAVAAEPRRYRQRWLEKDGTRIIRMSEPSAYYSFTPSGTKSTVVITRGTAPGLGETHWRLEVVGHNANLSADEEQDLYYILGDTAIATTTYTDSTLKVSDYPLSYELAPAVGEFLNWPAVRFIISDGNRLIGAGTTESTGYGSRIFFSPVLGSTDMGDLERVPINSTHENFITLNEKDGGSITGLAPSMNGSFYAFKRRQIWRISATGDDVTPYLPRLITSAFGAINQASIVQGRNLYGEPALYFWSEEGPCRLVATNAGSTDVQYLGEDIKDLTSQITFAGYTQAYPFAIFYAGLHQVWFWFNYVNGGNTIPVKAVFDIMRGTIEVGDYVRGGWSIHTDFTAGPTMSHGAACAAMFANTLGASMSSDLKPYAGLSSSAVLLKCDTTDTTDNAQNFQAYVKSRPLDIQQFGDNVGLGVSSLLADPATGVNITLSMIRDYGLETRTSAVSLTAAASETKVIRKFEDSEIAGAGVVQVQLGDSAAVAATQWKLHELALTVFPQEPR
jgi:hypothetical protein